MRASVDELQQAIREVTGRYYQLILVVGTSGSGKTTLLRQVHAELGYPYVNVSLELSSRMLALPWAARSLRAPRLSSEVLAVKDASVVLADNTELMFEPRLQLDQLGARQQGARERVVVPAGGGRGDGTALSPAAPGQSKYPRRETPDAHILVL
jgi:hypothetical protein